MKNTYKDKYVLIRDTHRYIVYCMHGEESSVISGTLIRALHVHTYTSTSQINIYIYRIYKKDLQLDELASIINYINHGSCLLLLPSCIYLCWDSHGFNLNINDFQTSFPCSIPYLKHTKVNGFSIFCNFELETWIFVIP